MPCLPLIIAIFFPRVVMVFVWLFTRWFSQAFDTALWPLLGFFFMPYTTLAYMAAMLNNQHTVNGFWLVIIVVAALIDLGGHGHSAKRGRRWWRD